MSGAASRLDDTLVRATRYLAHSLFAANAPRLDALLVEWCARPAPLQRSASTGNVFGATSVARALRSSAGFVDDERTHSAIADVERSLRTLTTARTRFVLVGFDGVESAALRVYPFGDEPPYDAMYVTDTRLTAAELEALQVLVTLAARTCDEPTCDATSSIRRRHRLVLNARFNAVAASYIDSYALVERAVARALTECSPYVYAMFRVAFEAALSRVHGDAVECGFGDRSTTLIERVRTHSRGGKPPL